MRNFEQYKKKNCRYCDNHLPETFLDLGVMPLANSFIEESKKEEEEFVCPLSITRCDTCGLVQLTHVVPADLMFSHYLYVSSTTKTFKTHFAEYAKQAKSKLQKKDRGLAVDIGSNDGLLLSCFQNEGMTAVGVEPALNLSSEANKNGFKTLNKYFNEECVNLITKEYGKADIITANNVFAHIDDVQDVCRNVNKLLDDNGIFIIEFPYMAVMLEDMVFDMIYHEHLSYINITPLKYLLKKFDLEIFSIDRVASHGGSLRVFIKKVKGSYPIDKIMDDLLKMELEKGYNEMPAYTKFAEKVQAVKNTLIQFVNENKSSGKSIAGYGAPAKGNTLINYCLFNDKQIDFIVDDNPLKQSMLSPGAKIPIVPGAYLHEHPTDFLIIFAWNFAKEIIEKNSALKQKGVKFIIPLPEPKIV